MYIDHLVTFKIARVLEMVDKAALLMDIEGNVIIPQDDSRVFNLPEQVKAEPTTPMVYGGVTLIGTSDEQPLFICLHGDSEEIRKCAMLCAELINRILREDLRQTDCEQSLRLMLGGEIDADEFEALAAEHGIAEEKRRCVLVFRFDDMESETALTILTNEKDEEDDLAAIMGRHIIAVIKAVDDENSFDEIEQYALAVEESFLTEYGTAVCAGVSDPCDKLTELPDAYRQAKDAIEIGASFHGNRSVYIYRNLLLERFLGDVPVEMCEDYNARLFNKKTSRLFNEEMLRTIEAFFDNSLNLSETARKLYIHRNTLVYRLEKIQRSIGLDLRVFDDAVTFKMMMLLGRKDASKKGKK